MSVSSAGEAAAKCKRITLTHYRVSFTAPVVNFASVEKKKNKQGAKTQRVDPPKFTTRMPKTSRCEKDGNALISPLNFSQSDHRLYLRIVHVNVTKRNFMVTDGDHHEFQIRVRL